jgi:hypothetical protein
MKQKEGERERGGGLELWLCPMVGEDFMRLCVVEGAIRRRWRAKEGLSCVACSRVLRVIGVEWSCAKEPVILLRD